MLCPKFKEFRVAANLSQKEVADKLAISSGALSSYELGRYEPSLKIVSAMAELYHCTVDELLGREVPAKKEPAPDKPEDRLPPVEEQLLKLWRNMADDQRIALVTAAFQILNKTPRDPQ